MFAAPSTGSDSVKPADLLGHLLLVTPLELKEAIPTAFGESSAIAVDVVDLDTNEEYHDVLFFGRGLIANLKSNIGAQVLGRMSQGIARPGQSAPWILEAATDTDTAKAVAYVQAKATGNISAPAPTATTPATTPVADVNDPAIAALIAQLTASK
jgi:hypothetical protein